MTREEAVDLLDNLIGMIEDNHDSDYDTAFKMAIEALGKESVLNKIRAEIFEEKECAYADFERYKVEYLRQDWGDVHDSLPQDDFRYGMERCIDIIDKCRSDRGSRE